MVFRNYGFRNTWLDNCLKSLVSEDPLRGKLVNGPKHWFSLNDSSFTRFIDQCEGNWVGKSLCLLTWKTSRLFVNTLNADDKYCLLSRDNLMQPNQIYLSQNQKNVAEFFLCISQIYIEFSTFSNKDDSHRLCITEITDSEIPG